MKTQAVDSLPDAPQAAIPLEAQAQASIDTAQTETPPLQLGSIHGTVVDREGSVYEGVRITLTRPSSALAIPFPDRSVLSDSDGHFSFAAVIPGPFQLIVDSSGFATQKFSAILHSGESYEAPAIILLVSNTTSEIEVTASRFEMAQEELKEEEQQRVFGVLPNFYVVYSPNAQPLNTRQKFHLAWRSSIDPVTFLVTGFAAGIQMGEDDFKGYGQGASGYAKRYGASYADNFIGNMMGGAVFPALFKQDPRYFYNGRGTIRHRILYAIANAVICKGDNGHWQFDYSGILGSLAAGGISNIYYPASDRNGATLTITNTLTGIGGSAIGNLFQEFLVRRLTPRLPSYGSPSPAAAPTAAAP